MKENLTVSVFYIPIKVYFFAGKKIIKKTRKKKVGDLGNCFYKYLAHSKIEFLIFIMCGRPITGKKSNQKIQSLKTPCIYDDIELSAWDKTSGFCILHVHHCPSASAMCSGTHWTGRHAEKNWNRHNHDDRSFEIKPLWNTLYPFHFWKLHDCYPFEHVVIASHSCQWLISWVGWIAVCINATRQEATICLAEESET